MEVQSKSEAQRRVDQIASFQAELALLEQEKVLSLNERQRDGVSAYHKALIASMSRRFDIDAGKRAKQLSLGMKISSFLGALCLAASVFLLFYQFWGTFSTSAQVAILIAAPGIALVLTMYASGREKTGYFAKLFAFVGFACFVLNLSMFGQIFNISPSPNAFLVWALFAFLLAYASDARLLLAAGILSLAGYLSAAAGTWGGCYWIHFGERPENFFPAALIIFVFSLLPHRRFSGFAELYRVFAMLLFFLPVLVLANWGIISYLTFAKESIESIYQVAGFLCSALAIWAGIQKNWPEVVNCGNVFFTIFLYTKFYDWWWDWMPKYLFFLLIGLTAIIMLLFLKSLRNATMKRAREVGQ